MNGHYCFVTLHEGYQNVVRIINNIFANIISGCTERPLPY